MILNFVIFFPRFGKYLRIFWFLIYFKLIKKTNNIHKTKNNKILFIF